VRTKVGDVFQIPVNDHSVAYGQIVSKMKPNPPLMAVFEKLYPPGQSIDIETIVRDEIVFLVNSFDSKITSGEWPLIGNRPPDERMVLPNFKTSIGSPGNFYVMSYDATRRRPATAEEARWLPLRSSVSPSLLQQAIRAHHKLETYLSDFSDFEYEKVLASSRLSL